MTDHAHSAATHGHDAHADHGGLGKYVMVFAALCVLTLISFTVARTEAIMNTPSVGWSIMMAVSTAKALLVISFFMHLIWEANWKWVLTIPASIMSCFLVLMLVPDVGYRTRHYSSERLIYAPPAIPHRSHSEHHGAPLPFDLEDVAKAAEAHEHEGEKKPAH